jgi:glycosyltransferase involved in cell wall biosynthesis
MANQNLEEIAQLLKPIELTPLRESPLVSVLTANYNYARYLPEAIESVLAQTYTNFELIVCDDGSTDESCSLVERYARRDPRIKLIRKDNGGVASALNAAYRESKGEIVCLLDADDRFLPEKLAMVVQGFESHPDSGFLGHRMFLIDAGGHRQGQKPLFKRHPSGWYGPFVVRYGDFPPAVSFGSGLCLRREISDLIFPMPVKFVNAADGVIIVLAALMTPIVGIDVPLTDYRFHGQNVMNTANVTVEAVERILYYTQMLWEHRREYLQRVNPRLNEASLEFNRHVGTLMFTYMQKRLRANGGSLSAYRDLVRAEGFRAFHPVTRWFWRFSILLPGPLFRHALNELMLPARVKQLIWRATRRLTGGSSGVDSCVAREG